MKTKMTIKKFAKQFSFSDWSYLCSNDEFEKAVTFADWGQAEVIARRLLNP
jgi:hypothetical protein